ncbi:MAG TPA: ribonuclease HI family protein [Herminiimonas sp.]|nr:ribonuclease HI family protein [Herminiimonas sp.]
MNDLFDIAYKKERASSRRLASLTGITEEEALKQTLQAKAGDQTLTELIAYRRQQCDSKRTRIAERKERKEAVRMQKLLSQQPDPAAWLAWFDGATHPNPGKMGIGGLLKSPDGAVKEISFNAGLGDSSNAEYIALIAVLEAAVEAKPAKLVVYGDSQVVLNDVNPTTIGESKVLTEKREQARRLIAQLADVTLCWIPRKKNAEADALSQRAVLQVPATPQTV